MEKNPSLVYFNTQTTGLKEPSICELAAEVDEQDYPPFHRYILPTKPFQPNAKNQFQLSPDGTKLLFKGRDVNADTQKDALKAFVKWLKEIPNPVLVDHYVPFHIRVLKRAFANFPKLGRRYDTAVKEIVDTRELFKTMYRPPLTRDALVGKILGEKYSYEKFTARDHVRSLRDLIKKRKIAKTDILRFLKSKPKTTINIKNKQSVSGDGVGSSRRNAKKKRKNKEETGKDREGTKRKKLHGDSDEDTNNEVKKKMPSSTVECMSSADTLKWRTAMERKKQEKKKRTRREKEREKPNIPKNAVDGTSSSSDSEVVGSSRRNSKRKQKNKEEPGKDRKRIKRVDRDSDEDTNNEVKTKKPSSTIECLSSADTPKRRTATERKKQEQMKRRKMERKKQEKLKRRRREKERKKPNTPRNAVDGTSSSSDTEVVGSSRRNSKRKQKNKEEPGKDRKRIKRVNRKTSHEQN